MPEIIAMSQRSRTRSLKPFMLPLTVISSVTLAFFSISSLRGSKSVLFTVEEPLM